jgi:hypothetical protein
VNKIPTKEEFEITLADIAERDNGTPELLEAAQALEPTEKNIKEFLRTKLKLIRKRRYSVSNSPIPVWLLTQPYYQKGVKQAFKNKLKPLTTDEWLDRTTNRYLNSYQPVNESWFKKAIFDYENNHEASIPEQFSSYNSELNRRSWLNQYAIDDLRGRTSKPWDAMYISQLYAYFFDEPTNESMNRKDNYLVEELVSIDNILSRLDCPFDSFFIRRVDETRAILLDLREDLKKDQQEGFNKPNYLRSAGESLPERRVLLALWQWFKKEGNDVSVGTLHDLLDIDGISNLLPSVRSMERNRKDWRKIDEKRR